MSGHNSRDLQSGSMFPRPSPAEIFWTCIVPGVPSNPSGWVFLRNAVMAIGLTKYGRDWNPAYMALTAWRPEDHPGGLLPSGSAEPLRSGLLAGLDPNYLEPEARAANRERAGEIKRLIAREAEAGRLSTGYRPLIGGKVTPCPAEWWNTERHELRFAECKIDPGNPFDDPAASVSAAYIFVGRKRLGDLLDVLRGRKKPSGRIPIASGSRKKPGPKGYGEAFWAHAKTRYMAKLHNQGIPVALSDDPKWRTPQDAITFVTDIAAERIEKHAKENDRYPQRSTIQAKLAQWDSEYLAGSDGQPAS